MVRRKRRHDEDKDGMISFKRRAEFSYKGLNQDDLKKTTLEEFKKLVNSRQRRSLKRGFTEKQRKLLEKIRATKRNEEGRHKTIKTHVRNLVIVPEMIGYTINVYNGKTFVPVSIKPQMVGHYLGEFSLTRKPITHGAPGIGASKSSTAVSGQKK